MSPRLEGILPALITPLDAGERVNTGALERLLDRVYAAGVDGVYLCGNTGEGMALDASERRTVAEVAVRASPPGKQVVVHVGAASLRAALDLAHHAARLGVTAISSLPPAGISYEELLEYYRALAAASGLPVIAYYFPDLGGGALTPDQLFEIAHIPGVAGFKFTHFDLYTLSLLSTDGLPVFNGRDEVLAAGLLMGAAGGIGSTYNLAPEWFVEIFSLARSGRWAEARALQDRVNRMVRLLLRFPLVPALKRVLTWKGIDCGMAVRPRRPLTPAEDSELRAGIERLLP